MCPAHAGFVVLDFQIATDHGHGDQRNSAEDDQERYEGDCDSAARFRVGGRGGESIPAPERDQGSPVGILCEVEADQRSIGKSGGGHDAFSERRVEPGGDDISEIDYFEDHKERQEEAPSHPEAEELQGGEEEQDFEGE